MKRLVRNRTHSAEDTKQTPFLRESNNMTQLQPQPPNPVDLTSMSFSFGVKFDVKLKDQHLHINFCLIQNQIAFTELARTPYFLLSLIGRFPTLNLLWKHWTQPH